MVPWSKDFTPILLNRSTFLRKKTNSFLWQKTSSGLLCVRFSTTTTITVWTVYYSDANPFSSEDYLFLLIINKNLCNPQSATYASLVLTYFFFVSSFSLLRKNSRIFVWLHLASIYEKQDES